MFLEERVRNLEERLVHLENSSGPGEDMEQRLAGLEELSTQLTEQVGELSHQLQSFNVGLDSRFAKLDGRFASLEEQGDSDFDERLDQVENTCSDLLNSEQAFRSRCEKLETQLGGMSKQVEDLLEQLADLDARDNAPDMEPYERRLQKMREELQGVRDDVAERVQGMHVAIDHQNSRLAGVDEFVEDHDGRLSNLEGKVASQDARFQEFDETIQLVQACLDDVSGRDSDTRLKALEKEKLAQRVGLLEQSSTELSKEVSWLSNRPQSEKRDMMARLIGTVAVAAGIAAIALVFWPWATISAQRFVLVDNDRQPLGEWVSAEHGASFEMQDREGKRRLFLAASGEGSLLSLFDGAGFERTRILADGSAGSGMLVLEPSGQQRLWCGQTTRPAVCIFDGEGNLRGSMAMEVAGPELTLREESAKPRVRLITGTDDNGLRVYDSHGKMRVGVGMSSDGAAVNLFDPAEQRRVVLSSNDKGTALAFLGDDNVQRTTIGLTEKNESILNLHDDDGRQRILLFASLKEAGVQVLDRDTKVLFSGP